MFSKLFCINLCILLAILSCSSAKKEPAHVAVHDGQIINPTVPPQPHSDNKTTTERPTTTSTEPPTTKSTTTTTSTEPPTTKSTTTTTSTTTVAPQPAPTPNPIPTPQVGVWNVTHIDKHSNKSVACIVISTSINLSVVYVKSDPKNASLSTNETVEFPVPINAQSHGDCGNGNNTQWIELKWNKTISTDKSNSKVYNFSVKISFDKNNKSEFYLKNIISDFKVDQILFPGVKNDSTEFRLATFNSSYPVEINKSYLCARGLDYNMTNSEYVLEKIYSKIHLGNVKFQAFANITDDNTFGVAIDCCPVGPSFTPDYVPILVGVSLAALVAVVLIAYIIGRRRSTARGYLSM